MRLSFLIKYDTKCVYKFLTDHSSDMLKDQCISVTELRTKTKKCLENVDKTPKYVFFNNHPIAVLLGIAEYEERFLNPRLVELDANEVDITIAKQASVARKSKKSELMNLR